MRHAALAFAIAACLAAPLAAQAQWKIGDRTISRDDIATARQLWIVGSEVLNPDEVPDTFDALRQSYGVMGDEHLDAHLNQVLSRLQSSWHEAPVSARVYVSPDPAFRAFATVDGGIIVAAGMLASMESEDELAALLAHEYAHLLLNHNAPTVLESLARRFSGAAEVYLNQRHGMPEGDPSTRLVRDLMARHVVAESMQTAMAPARSRRDENSADALAIDLMIAAGYSPVGMADMLGRMESWEAHLAAQQEEHEQRQTTLQTVVTAHVTGGRIGVESRESRKQMLGNAVGGVFSAFERGVQRWRRQHDAPSVRLDNVLDHLDNAHPDHDRPEIRPLPWAGDARVEGLLAEVSQVHQLNRTIEQQGIRAAEPLADRVRRGPAAAIPFARMSLLRLQLNGSVRSWEDDAVTELREPDSLYQTHFMVLDRFGDSSTKRAVEALEVSRQSLGDSRHLLPHSVHLYTRAGDRERANEYALRCHATGDEDLQRTCQAYQSRR